MALQANDGGYEKTSTWEGSLLNDERDAFLGDEPHNLPFPPHRVVVNFRIILLVSSGLLNILLLIFIGQQYSQRGASNLIFPQSTYCRYSRFVSHWNCSKRLFIRPTICVYGIHMFYRLLADLCMPQRPFKKHSVTRRCFSPAASVTRKQSIWATPRLQTKLGTNYTLER